jgi:hypothetical protein
MRPLIVLALALGLGMLQLGCPARDLLAQRQRRCVLQVRTADLDDVSEAARLGVQGLSQGAQGGQQTLLKTAHAGHADCGRKDVVGRLAAVDVIVRVHQA